MKRSRSPAQRDQELVVGARAHFEDPDYYTSTYANRIEDVAFYAALATEHAPRGPVLEYGIGNGRVALALARHGVSVVGIDHTKEMLVDLKRRLAEEPIDVRKRIRAKQGDMRTVALGKKFPLVIAPFNVCLHLYDRVDVERFLTRVKAHLAPGGLFVADLSLPIASDLARSPEQAFRTPRFRHPAAGLVRYTERFDYDPIRQILFVAMEFEPLDGKPAFATPLAHRQFYPQEWEALLHYNGFTVTRVAGDFQGGPLTPTSDVMVTWAKRSKR